MPFVALLVLALAAGTPAPPASSATPSPLPSPSATPPLVRIGETSTTGRKADLVGRAQAASEGTIDERDIATRPVLRPAEVLEEVPGLVISQHSGEGKANQYYLRGFQLDHGTDLEGTIGGVPVNLPTHAHGQGYSDINWLIPELAGFVQYEKGPYYASRGDFSTAGAYQLYYRDAVAPTLSLGIGAYGYDRLYVADAPRLGAGRLLYGLELYHDNGSFDKPDRYAKVNGLLRWSRETANTLFNVTAWGYHGSFNSSDQIPARLVDAGVLDRYGAFDPSDGGSTYRYAVSSELVRTDARGTTRASAYVFAYGLQLFSNFEYDLNDASDFYNVTANPVTCNQLYAPCNAALHDYGGPRVGSATSTGSYTPYCPANAVPTGGATLPGSVPVSPSQFTFSCGDQREQLDRRVVSGFDVSRSFNDAGRVRTLAGLSVRNDAVGTVGLFLTHDRSRYPAGRLSDDSAVERDLAAYLQSEADLGTKLRITLGLRADLYNFAVHDAQPANAGRRNAGIVSPKFLAAYAFSRRQEAYLDVGESFHSNDARGVFQTLDPQTHAPFDPTGAPVQPVVPLVRAVGYEAGYRYAGTRFHAALSLWRLDLASELVFDGDHGTTAPAGPTRRKGIEVSTDYALNRFVTLDADVATSTAHFLSDADQQGIFVPESLNVVTSAGLTVDRPFYAASLRLRYFGPRTLDRSGTAVSLPSSLLNAQVTAKMRGGSALSLDVFNLLDARADDVEYYYHSWTPQDARNPAYASDPAVNPALGGAGIPGYTFHPSQRRTVRLSYTTRLR